jgi:enediyne biosynthesis protein E4
MGVDAADINNDLLPDLAVLDMMPNTNERKKMMVLGFTPEKFEMQRNLGYQQQFSRNMLQLNQGLRENGEPVFSEIGHLAGIAETDWSWSILMADFDNDSWRDIHISNGLARDLTNNDFIAFTQDTQEAEYSFGGGNNGISAEKINKWVKRLEEFGAVKKTNFFFKNTQSLQFDDVSEAVGIAESSVSQGAAYADFDNDGDLDIMVNNMNQEAFVMRNEVRKSAVDSTHNFLRIELKGNLGNLTGLGAKVVVYANNQVQIVEQTPIRGYASTVDNRLHFGVGESTKIDSLKVIWASGKSQKKTNIKANQTLVLSEKEAFLSSMSLSVSSLTTLLPTLFTPSSELTQTTFKHQETPFFDYYIRRLQPQKYSQLGPCMAKGDINGDGLEDIFVGGAAWQSGKIFIQNKQGGFTEKDLESKPDDDLAAEFFDVDADKDLDLLITGGSTEYQRGYTSQPRLYINDGKGNFHKNVSAFPANTDIFSSTIATNDFDHDGDLDIFIGGRINKEHFPASPRSYIFQNNKGVFKDITPDELQNIGMITDALWLDIDNDKIEDLVVAGEWMPIRSFKNNGKKLTEINQKNMPFGMWRSLASADIDGDGDKDLVAGNYGQNNKYHASTERPYQLFAKDLDNNGTTELIPAYFIKNNKGKYDLFPDLDRSQFAEQTPIIKKKYLLYKDYAQASMNQLLDDIGLDNLQKFSCESTTSVWLENLGNGTFKSHDLPLEAQFAPINTILINDFDGDKKQDILLAGNEYQTEVSTGRTDASLGLLLKGDGKGNFKAIGQQKSGFLVEGDVKSMLIVGKQLWVGLNNEKIKSFKIK